MSAPTAFSLLLLPPLMEEFDWDRGVAAGAFSFGFLVPGLRSPPVGRWTRGPVYCDRGVSMVAAGLLLAPAVRDPGQLYETLGVLVGAGANLMQTAWKPNRNGFRRDA